MAVQIRPGSRQEGAGRCATAPSSSGAWARRRRSPRRVRCGVRDWGCATSSW